MERYTYDKSHYIAVVGKMQRLMTLAQYVVTAGESLTMFYKCLFRLSQLRRALSLNAVLDIMVYYQPFRHDDLWGTDFMDFLADGVDNSVTFTGITTPSSTYDIACLGGNLLQSTSYPSWRFNHYNSCWNNYHRFLKLTPEIPMGHTPGTSGYPSGHSSSNSRIDGTAEQTVYGYNCTRLKRDWSTGITAEVDGSDREVSSATVLDIIELEQTKARLKTERQREYYSDRYEDLVNQIWGGNANTDARQRPTLIWRETKTIGGQDVNATDSSGLGDYSGKAMAGHDIFVPRKFYPEHGVVSVCALMRFPTVLLGEHDILRKDPNPSYEEVSGDPDVIASQPPYNATADEWLSGSGSVAIGQTPFGNHYRSNPNIIHRNFTNLGGYPWLPSNTVDSHVKAVYGSSAEYDHVFLNTALGHWQGYCSALIQSDSPVPTAKSSIFAGA